MAYKVVYRFIIPCHFEIVNCSLCSGVFPENYKNAVVLPLLKKTTLDPEVASSYRPVSKIIEGAVAEQLKDRLATNGLSETFQSAYRSGCSTETALLRVQNDILMSIDLQAVGLV